VLIHYCLAKIAQIIKVRISHIVENDFFGFRKIKWLQLTGVVGHICRILMSNFLRISHTHTHQKVIKIG